MSVSPSTGASYCDAPVPGKEVRVKLGVSLQVRVLPAVGRQHEGTLRGHAPRARQPEGCSVNIQSTIDYAEGHGLDPVRFADQVRAVQEVSGHDYGIGPRSAGDIIEEYHPTWALERAEEGLNDAN